MTGPLFSVAKLNSEEFCELCGKPARFKIVPALLNVENKLCDMCAVAYTLQYFKNFGVELSEIQEAFPMVSAAVDAPLGSLLLQ
jgi:hypothetical protein